MKRIARGAVCLILTVSLLLCTVSASAVSAADIQNKTESTCRYLQTLTPQVGYIGGEWLVLGLARAGKLDQKTADSYYHAVVSYVQEKGAKLHRSKSTDNSRVILALTAIDKNVTDVAGYNLLEPLADFSYVTKQGINGAVWALIALDSLLYEIPQAAKQENQTTRERLITYICGRECPQGGWSLDGENADPDMTGMALCALAPYYQSHTQAAACVKRALQRLSVIQSDDGAFATDGAVTPESGAQIITALSSLGINAQTDSRFVKNDKSVFDSVMSFAVINGFEHSPRGGYNQMATEQAYYAFVAYQRVLQSQTSLYDMTDLRLHCDVNLDNTVDITDATLIQKALADMVSLSLLQQKLADADGSGSVAIADVTTIQRILANLQE